MSRHHCRVDENDYIEMEPSAGGGISIIIHEHDTGRESEVILDRSVAIKLGFDLAIDLMVLK